jgi:CubicO group peptidase (beta-lactamase class C family)
MKRFATFLVLLALLDTAEVLAAEPAWRRGLRPAAGYSAEQARKFHEMFELSTWQVTKDADYARYTLQRTAEFFPQAVIPRSGPHAVLTLAPTPAVGQLVVETPGFGKLPLDQFLEKSQTDAFIVVHRGKIVYEQYPRLAPSAKHLFWSVTKTFAGLLVAQLEAEGRVQADKPIETYVPELVNTAWSGTPVLDVLDQASGMDALEDDEANTWERPELAVFQYESSLGLLPKTPAAERSTYDIVAAIRRLRPSGERFEYLSVNTFVLGWLVERVTGKPYVDALAERIWSRIGADADALLVVSPRTGAPASHGGISGTLRDLARYGLLYTPSWASVASARVVPEDYLRKVQKGGRPQLLERAAPGSKEAGGDGVEPARYSTYQWDAVWADGDFFKYGFRGQGLYVSPSRDLVVAFFGTERQSQVRYARALARSGLFEDATR